MNAKSAKRLKRPSGRRSLLVTAGQRRLAKRPSAIGTASSASRLHQIAEASMSSLRSQAEVAGLLATIQVKLNGVTTSASSAATES